ncbi:MAG TPA: PaaX family transcriptional regulator C-terminal domain-containing protein [Acidimicrobiales bacterium]|nr:PaaX family transcriptional regulator C-terminal domain-containing protein [Acidimicrobiales bacterium]
MIASVLLPLSRPELPAHTLVKCGELFGISSGTCRVALSRMVAAGELEANDGSYRLTGTLLDRRQRQEQGRRPRLVDSGGRWWVAVVTAEGRDASERAALRTALGRLRMGELREGVWARPDNFADWDDQLRRAGSAVAQCHWFSSVPARIAAAANGRSLAERLWDLDDWADLARVLVGELSGQMPLLHQGDTRALAPGFRVAAGVVRHLTSDPLLPEELLPARWPGPRLRADYDAYEEAYQRVLRDWLRSAQRDVAP